MPYSATLIRAKEETERRVVFAPTDDTDVESPAYRCQAYRDMAPDVVLMTEVSGGTKSMREAGEKYLPKHPLEKSEKHRDRVRIAVAYNALKRTVGGLVGMVFRRDPVASEDIEQRVADELENVDMRGRSLAVFLRSVGEGAMRDGHSWVHVEAPPASPLVQTREDEASAGVRPYWIQISKAQAINWRFEIRAGRPVLTLFAYTESAVEAVGAFGEDTKERIRVLREVREEGEAQIQGELWELQEATEDKEKPRWRLIEGPYVIGIDRIPVVFVPADPASPEVREFMSDPPLRDLAYEQVEHYRVRSDRQRSMTFSSVAVPYHFGKDTMDAEGNPVVRWSPDGMLLSNDPEATAGIIESHGFGLEATKQELTEIEGRMAALGLQMLVGRASPQPQTATERILDKTESDASLALFAQSLESAANQALALHYRYRKGAEVQGDIQINTDFHEQLIDAELLKRLVEMVGARQLSLTTLWDLLVEGELLGEDFDPEEEMERIREEDASGLADDPMVQALRDAMARPEEEEDEAA